MVDKKFRARITHNESHLCFIFCPVDANAIAHSVFNKFKCVGESLKGSESCSQKQHQMLQKSFKIDKLFDVAIVFSIQLA